MDVEAEVDMVQVPVVVKLIKMTLAGWSCSRAERILLRSQFENQLGSEIF